MPDQPRRDHDGGLPIRSVPFTVTRAEPDGEGGDGLTMEGYAAVFDRDTQIDSWEGRFTERLKRGVFRNSLRGGRRPMLQYDHGQHPLIGSIPIGSIRDVYEDDHGLFVRARLTDNWLIQPIRDAIRDGGVQGMSFRFEPIRDEWRDNTGKLIKDPHELQRLLRDAGERGPISRTLTEVRLVELGPVAWPAYQETAVGVRSAEARSVLDALQDPTVRAEVARALLVDPPVDGDEPAESGEGGPATTEDPPDNPPVVEEDPAAPPAESGPPADRPTDAPPAESGPPSAPPEETPGDDAARAAAAIETEMRAALREVRNLRDDTPPVTTLRSQS